MSHPHQTTKGKQESLDALKTFEDKIDALQMDGHFDVNENASSIIFGLIEVTRHEIERIPVEDR